MSKTKKKDCDTFYKVTIAILFILLFLSIVANFSGNDKVVKEILRDYEAQERQIYQGDIK